MSYKLILILYVYCSTLYIYCSQRKRTTKNAPLKQLAAEATRESYNPLYMSYELIITLYIYYKRLSCYKYVGFCTLRNL